MKDWQAWVSKEGTSGVQSTCFIPVHLLGQKKMFPPCLKLKLRKLENQSSQKIQWVKGCKKKRPSIELQIARHWAWAIILNDEWNGPYCKNMSPSLVFLIPTAHKQNPNPHHATTFCDLAWGQDGFHFTHYSHWGHNIEIALNCALLAQASNRFTTRPAAFNKRR